MTNTTEQFRLAMRDSGLVFDGEIHADGKLHRFKACGDKRASSWYVLHDGGHPVGVFGCHKRGIPKTTWVGTKGWQPSAADIAKMRQQEARKRRDDITKAAAARIKAKKLWAACRKVGDSGNASHPYLTLKGITAPYGIGFDAHDNIVLPLQDSTGKLHSLQFISPDGVKMFLSGGRVRGCFFAIVGGFDNTAIVCEGFATGVSIHQATDAAVLCAMFAANLEAVARECKKAYPTADIIIAADNDAWTDGNPGVTQAKLAADAIGAKLAVPTFCTKHLAETPTDFNDLHRLCGLRAVREQILAAR